MPDPRWERNAQEFLDAWRAAERAALAAELAAARSERIAQSAERAAVDAERKAEDALRVLRVAHERYVYHMDEAGLSRDR